MDVGNERDKTLQRTIGPSKAPHTNANLTNARRIEEHQYDGDYEDYPEDAHD
jgi:hypothetical protein